MNELAEAAVALDGGRSAEALAIVTAALEGATDSREEETLLALGNYCAWLVGDWTDMATMITNFRRVRQLATARNAGARSMTAAVAPKPGRLELAQVPEPQPLAGFVKIRVRAFGLNRTEKFLEMGGWPVSELSPVAPLINGIECAGEVVGCGPPIGDETQLAEGTRVLACASSLGRGIDGTHAEYVVVPRWGVVAVPEAGSHLSWRELAALPLSFGTAAGSLAAMDTQSSDTVLVRGGTSALGLSAITLAKHAMGCTVLATSRRATSEPLLRSAGADEVLIEPEIRGTLRALYPDGVDRALECIGEATLKDTMHCVRRGGVMCQTGALSHEPGFNLHLLGEVPSSVKVTCYESDTLTAAVLAPLIDRLLNALAAESVRLPLDPTEFSLQQYKAAMAFLDSKDRKGKVVVTVP